MRVCLLWASDYLSNLRQEKHVTNSTLVKIAEVVLKNNIFTLKEKTLKQQGDTALGT